MVARAWVDEAFRRDLLADARKTLKEQMQIDQSVKLVVFENGPKLHNVIVCTHVFVFDIA